MKFLWLALTISIPFFACNKALDVHAIWQCNNSLNLDSTGISKKLVGSWKWVKQSCFEIGKVTSADRNIKVTFNSNATFSVQENSSVITQGNWDLKIEDNSMWGLDLNSSSIYLHGRILFCDDRVLFAASYRDGCDNLFEKIQ